MYLIKSSKGRVLNLGNLIDGWDIPRHYIPVFYSLSHKYAS